MSCKNCELLKSTLQLMVDTALSDDKSERLASVFAGRSILRHFDKCKRPSMWRRFLNWWEVKNNGAL